MALNGSLPFVALDSGVQGHLKSRAGYHYFTGTLHE